MSLTSPPLPSPPLPPPLSQAKLELDAKKNQRELKKSNKKDAKKRLEFLLKQSDVFRALQSGASTFDGSGSGDEDTSGNSGKRNGNGNGNSNSSGPPSPSKRARSDSVDPEEEEEDEFSSTYLTAQPPSIKFGTLKGYQLEGLNWMIHLQDKGLNGILADEMGLGKTLQSISIMAYNFDYLHVNGPHLVVVPKSTLSNWMNEFNRWCPSLRIFRFHGNKEDRELMRDTMLTHQAAGDTSKRPTSKLENGKDDHTNSKRAFDVCVTTYEVCNLETAALTRFAWNYLVIDEAHRLKNEASTFSKTVRGFHTKHRLLLTGTPLQNNLHELWALLNFLLPDIFSDADQFDEWFNLDIDDDDQKKSMISTLHKILRPFMLRRLKVDVATNLPPKAETLLMVGLSGIQKQLYKKLLIRDIDSLVVGDNVTKKGSRTSILNIIMQLRKCCGHPYLFEGIEDRSLNPMGEHVIQNCGKMVLVDKLLKRLQEKGHRVLIFTQMTRILDILEDVMVIRGYKYCRIDGNTTHDVREDSIDAYNAEGSEKFVFLLSTRAGGLGINLQTADTVILYDSDWNPQADLQAQDRAHRIGQKKPVQIYRLVTENTIEEKIVERAQQKLKLDAMVVQSGRLKDKDKVSKEEMMAAIKFGADQVFRSSDSDITDEDIDAILARGEEKTKELQAKLEVVDKGDLLDFKMDGGLNYQTMDGVDYSDKAFRDELKLLDATQIGKRERRQVEQFMFEDADNDDSDEEEEEESKGRGEQGVKGNKTLPRHFRLPRMDDWQFFKKKRLEELSLMEIDEFKSLIETRSVPPRDKLNKMDSILPENLAREKRELLAEGFPDWTKQNYFRWVKAITLHGRTEYEKIARDVKVGVAVVKRYTDTFLAKGEAQLGQREYNRVLRSIDDGDRKRAQTATFSKTLNIFMGQFKNPRTDISFSSKGKDFSLEFDRATLCATHAHGYSNWDKVRDCLREDKAFTFDHGIHGLSVDSLQKRADYRIRQLEREIKGDKNSLSIMQQQKQLARATKILRGEELNEKDEEEDPVDMSSEPKFVKIITSAEECPACQRGGNLKHTCKKQRAPKRAGGQLVVTKKVKISPPQKIDDSVWMNQMAAVDQAYETASAQCEQARQKLMIGESVKLSNISLSGILKENAQAEATAALFSGSLLAYTSSATSGIGAGLGGSSSSISSAISGGGGTKRGGSGDGRGTRGKKIKREWWTELAVAIGAGGMNRRRDVVAAFHAQHPETSERQVNELFGQLVIRKKPGCIPNHDKPSNNKAVWFYLRPHFYDLLPESARPEGWEGYKLADKAAWEEEEKKKADRVAASRAKEKAKKKMEKERQDILGNGMRPHIS